jgi:hypothetical protein
VEAARYLAAALNDRRRSRISDPRKNTWAVAFPSTDVHELATLAEYLQVLDLVFQTNYGNADLVRTGERQERAFLSIYEHESQQRLLDKIGEDLEGARRRALEDLVAARGAIPPDILRDLAATISAGKSYAYLADLLNREGIIAGMRGRQWTAKKVREALEPSEGQMGRAR